MSEQEVDIAVLFDDEHEGFEHRVINRLNHIIHQNNRSVTEMETDMTVLDDALAALSTEIGNVASRVQASLDALNAEIAALTAAGTDTTALTAAAAAINNDVAELQAIDPTPAPSPAPDPAPAPAPDPTPAPAPDPTPAPPVPDPTPGAALVLETATLNANVGQPLVDAVAASGGVGPYTYSLTGLPDGLAADTDGNITGTPTSVGTTAVQVVVTDSTTPSPLSVTGTVQIVVS